MLLEKTRSPIFSFKKSSDLTNKTSTLHETSEKEFDIIEKKKNIAQKKYIQAESSNMNKTKCVEKKNVGVYDKYGRKLNPKLNETLEVDNRLKKNVSGKDSQVKISHKPTITHKDSSSMKTTKTVPNDCSVKPIKKVKSDSKADCNESESKQSKTHSKINPRKGDVTKKSLSKQINENITKKTPIMRTKISRTSSSNSKISNDPFKSVPKRTLAENPKNNLISSKSYHLNSSDSTILPKKINILSKNNFAKSKPSKNVDQCNLSSDMTVESCEINHSNIDKRLINFSEEKSCPQSTSACQSKNGKNITRNKLCNSHYSIMDVESNSFAENNSSYVCMEGSKLLNPDVSDTIIYPLESINSESNNIAHPKYNGYCQNSEIKSTQEIKKEELSFTLRSNQATVPSHILTSENLNHKQQNLDVMHPIKTCNSMINGRNNIHYSSNESNNHLDLLEIPLSYRNDENNVSISSKKNGLEKVSLATSCVQSTDLSRIKQSKELLESFNPIVIDSANQRKLDGLVNSKIDYQTEINSVPSIDFKPDITFTGHPEHVRNYILNNPEINHHLTTDFKPNNRSYFIPDDQKHIAADRTINNVINTINADHKVVIPQGKKRHSPSRFKYDRTNRFTIKPTDEERLNTPNNDRSQACIRTKDNPLTHHKKKMDYCSSSTDFSSNNNEDSSKPSVNQVIENISTKIKDHNEIKSYNKFLSSDFLNTTNLTKSSLKQVETSQNSNKLNLNITKNSVLDQTESNQDRYLKYCKHKDIKKKNEYLKDDQLFSSDDSDSNKLNMSYVKSIKNKTFNDNDSKGFLSINLNDADNHAKNSHSIFNSVSLLIQFFRSTIKDIHNNVNSELTKKFENSLLDPNHNQHNLSSIETRLNFSKCNLDCHYTHYPSMNVNHHDTISKMLYLEKLDSPGTFLSHENVNKSNEDYKNDVFETSYSCILKQNNQFNLKYHNEKFFLCSDSEYIFERKGDWNSTNFNEFTKLLLSAREDNKYNSNVVNAPSPNSTEYTSSNNVLHLYFSPNEKLPPKHNSSASLPENTLIIWDWDDTILPTYYLAIEHPWYTQNEILSKELEDSLKILESKVIHSLALSMRNSCTILVTNASFRWLAESAMKYYPKLWNFIKEYKIKIVSARDICQPLGVPQSDWKRLVIRDQVEQFFVKMNVPVALCNRVSLLIDHLNFSEHINNIIFPKDHYISSQTVPPHLTLFFEKIPESLKLDYFCRMIGKYLNIDDKILTMTGLLIQQGDHHDFKDITTVSNQYFPPCMNYDNNQSSYQWWNSDDTIDNKVKYDYNHLTCNDTTYDNESELYRTMKNQLTGSSIELNTNKLHDECNIGNKEISFVNNEIYVKPSIESPLINSFNDSDTTVQNDNDSLIRLNNFQLANKLENESTNYMKTNDNVSEYNTASVYALNTVDNKLLVIPSLPEGSLKLPTATITTSFPYVISRNGTLLHMQDMFPHAPEQLGITEIPCSVISIGDGQGEREAIITAMASWDEYHRSTFVSLLHIRHKLNCFYEQFISTLEKYFPLSIRPDAIHTSTLNINKSTNHFDLKKKCETTALWTFKSLKLKPHPSVEDLSKTHDSLRLVLLICLDLKHSIDAFIQNNQDNPNTNSTYTINHPYTKNSTHDRHIISSKPFSLNSYNEPFFDIPNGTNQLNVSLTSSCQMNNNQYAQSFLKNDLFMLES